MAGSPRVTPIVVQQGDLQEGPSPFVTSFAGRGLLSQVQFHALTETAAAAPEALCQRALTSFQRLIASLGRISLTSALSQALQDCHQELRAANESEPLAARVGVGLTCLALRDDDLYIAQAGPGLLYLRDTHGVRRVESHSFGGSESSDEPSERQELGITPGEIRVSLDRYPFRDEHVFMAAGSALAAAVNYDGLDAILASAPDEAARKLQLLMPDQPFFAALMVTSSSRG